MPELSPYLLHSKDIRWQMAEVSLHTFDQIYHCFLSLIRHLPKPSHFSEYLYVYYGLLPHHQAHGLFSGRSIVYVPLIQVSHLVFFELQCLTSSKLLRGRGSSPV